MRTTRTYARWILLCLLIVGMAVLIGCSSNPGDSGVTYTDPPAVTAPPASKTPAPATEVPTTATPNPENAIPLFLNTVDKIVHIDANCEKYLATPKENQGLKISTVRVRVDEGYSVCDICGKDYLTK